MLTQQINIASLFGFVAEQQLSGCNARVRRVRGYCLKTPNLVFSTDHLFIYMNCWTLREKLWVPYQRNPTEQS